MGNGLRCSGSIPYGYMRKSGDKQTLYVDTEAAKVVRRIFEMASQGIGNGEIADTLSEEKVLIPSAYAETYYPEMARNHSYHDRYRWNCNSIRTILDRQEYLGHWESQRTDTTVEDRKGIATAQKRMSELDSLIKGLYEAGMTGSLPERQVQRLMSQYDEEQIQLEAKIGELTQRLCENTEQKPDTGRFLRLIGRYKDCNEITDEMLYELVEKVEIHAPTGGRTRYRQQKIDVHFNFIGSYTPPTAHVSEEERIAEIDRLKEEKHRAKLKRASERRKEKLREAKREAETNPEAAKKYEESLERKREYNRGYSRRKREEDPDYHRNRGRKQYRKLMEKRAELKEMAKTDENARAKLEAIREREAEKSKEQRERKL